MYVWIVVCLFFPILPICLPSLHILSSSTSLNPNHLHVSHLCLTSSASSVTLSFVWIIWQIGHLCLPGLYGTNLSNFCTQVLLNCFLTNLASVVAFLHIGYWCYSVSAFNRRYALLNKTHHSCGVHGGPQHGMMQYLNASQLTLGLSATGSIIYSIFFKKREQWSSYFNNISSTLEKLHTWSHFVCFQVKTQVYYWL